MQPDRFYSIHAGTISLRVKAKAGARADAVLGVRGAELLVSVRTVAEKGKANIEIARVIARALSVPHDSVVLKMGGSSPHKVFLVPVEAGAALKEIEGGAGAFRTPGSPPSASS
jgi:uncharacterized protein YggU (UPF0235/DUF167 family)